MCLKHQGPTAQNCSGHCVSPPYSRLPLNSVKLPASPGTVVQSLEKRPLLSKVSQLTPLETFSLLNYTELWIPTIPLRPLRPLLQTSFSDFLFFSTFSTLSQVVMVRSEPTVLYIRVWGCFPLSFKFIYTGHHLLLSCSPSQGCSLSVSPQLTFGFSTSVIHYQHELTSHYSFSQL